MWTIQVKNNGQRFWVDDLKRENGKYIFTYVRKDGTQEEHELSTDCVEDAFETKGTVKQFFSKKQKEEKEEIDLA